MKNFDDVKQQLQAFIRNERLVSAMELLNKVIHEDRSELRNDLLLLQSNYTGNSRDWNKEIIKYEHYLSGKKKVAGGLIDLIDSLEITDIFLPSALLEEISNPILIICSSEDSKRQIEAVFNSFYFTNVAYHFGEEPIPEIEAKEYELIILNSMFDSNFGFSMQLETYLNYRDNYFLYFGKKDARFENEKYARKLHFANSVFSLHARIREVLDFLKYVNASRQS